MGYARMVRVWQGASSRARCRRCQRPIRWVIDDRGKSRPFTPAATPLRTDTDERTRARFDVYEPEALHVCSAGKTSKPTRIGRNH